LASLRERYESILREVEDLAEAGSGTPPKVVAVSKYAPDDAVREAHAAGIRHLGESRAQDFEARRKRLDDLEGVRWHFLGHLQTNKVKKVIGAAALIHSVDSLRLLDAVDGRATREGLEEVPVLLQVNVSGEASKTGLAPEAVEDAAVHAAELPRVTVRGLMTMAPVDADEVAARRCFAGLRELHEDLRERVPDAYPGRELSMGMSQDYRYAVLEGATMVRIGSAIFQEGAH